MIMRFKLLQSSNILNKKIEGPECANIRAELGIRFSHTFLSTRRFSSVPTSNTRQRERERERVDRSK